MCVCVHAHARALTHMGWECLTEEERKKHSGHSNSSAPAFKPERARLVMPETQGSRETTGEEDEAAQGQGQVLKGLLGSLGFNFQATRSH